jgi:phosphoglycolate phosphatase-like HAD superfamily hydrolase
MSFKAIIFDFDGVLVNSSGIKSNAFVAVLEEFGIEFAQSVLDYQLKNCTNRYETFKHAGRLLNIRDKSFVSIKSKQFAELVKNSIIKAHEINGASQILSYLLSCKMPQFISSAAPQDELIEIIQARKWMHYFERVYGLPADKPGHIHVILDNYGLEPHEVLYVGDTMQDYKAAIETNVNFIARSDNGTFPVKTKTIKDLAQLLSIIKNGKNT